MVSSAKQQAGVSMLGILLICIVIVLVAIGALKIIPAYTEFNGVKSAVIAARDGGKTVVEIQKAFDKYAQVNDISVITAQDLDITKEGNAIVVSFKYDKKIPLVKNMSVLIEFAGSTNDP
jgi:Domain of unknown function (DUF4845)